LKFLLANFPAIMIHGPRATGKTTTARRFARDTVRLDQPRQAAVFRADPDAALRLFSEPILLDEWQEVPEVLGAVKRAVDADGRPGRFLLTGSVRADLEQQTWPATGRVVRMQMYGLTEREVAGRVSAGRPSFIDKLATADVRRIGLPPDIPDLPRYVEMALRGGFPEVVLSRRSEPARRAWLDSYLDQLLTRDAVNLEHGRDPVRLRRYFEALAVNTAGIAKDNTIFAAASVNAKTAAAYDRLLANLFVVEPVPAWSTNRLERLVKARKHYVVDAALAAAAGGLDVRAVLTDGDLLGRMVDTFGVAQLRPEAVLSSEPCRMYHLRVEGGRHEIDLVIERNAGRVLGIELKAGAAPDEHDARHLIWLRDRLGSRFIAGAVLHTGPHVYKIGDRILAAPLCAVWG
jgi:predicted AAA+ superfamily ATPase